MDQNLPSCPSHPFPSVCRHLLSHFHGTPHRIPIWIFGGPDCGVPSCKKSAPSRSNWEATGGIVMEDRLRSIVVRIREAFSARPRLVLAVCVAAGVFLLFLSVSKQSVPPAHQSSANFPPTRATTSAEFPP